VEDPLLKAPLIEFKRKKQQAAGNCRRGTSLLALSTRWCWSSNLEGYVASVARMKDIHEYRIFVLKPTGIRPHQVLSVGGRVILKRVLKELSIYVCMWIEINGFKLYTLLNIDFIKARNLSCSSKLL
jgi:hypothetical protein